MERAHTTEFIVKTEDHFTAHLDDGGVRIGFVGGTCFDFPACHAEFNAVVSLTAESIEDAYDDIYGARL